MLFRSYAQLKIEDTAQWSKVRDDIQAEIDAQRRSLNDLRMVLDPAVLKAKLALVGEGSQEVGKEASKDGGNEPGSARAGDVSAGATAAAPRADAVSGGKP